MKKFLSNLCFKLGKHFSKGHRLSDINRAIFFYTKAIKLGCDEARFYLLDHVLQPTGNLPKATDCLDRNYFWFKKNPIAALDLMVPLIKDGSLVQRTEARLTFAHVVLDLDLYRVNSELGEKAFEYAQEAYKNAAIIAESGHKQWTWRSDEDIVCRSLCTLGCYYAYGIGTCRDTAIAEELFSRGIAAGSNTCKKSLDKLLSEKEEEHAKILEIKTA